MSCSPLLKGIKEPLETLRIVSEHLVLCFSEPPQTFYPLKKKGWVVYRGGSWRITEEGHRAMAETPRPDPEPLTVAEFFDL